MTPEQNFAAARRAFEAKQETLTNLPTRMTVEPTSICNLRCVMCPHSINDVQRPRHTDIGLFEKIRTPLRSAQRIQLNGIGEPLASPSLWLTLDDDQLSPESEVTFNTNMTILNGSRIDRLVKSRSKLMLNVSLDAATAKTYRRIRGIDFAQPIKNLKALVAARGENQYPDIMLNMTLMRENIAEVVAFVDLAKELGVDSVGLWHLNQMPEAEMNWYIHVSDDWTFNYSEQGLWNFPTLSNAWICRAVARGVEIGMPVQFDQSKTIYFPDPISNDAQDDVGANQPAADEENIEIETVKDCTHPWDSVVILSDGSLRACCYSGPIGNLYDNTFDEIWNGEKFQLLRNELGRDVVSGVCQNAACKYVHNSRVRQTASVEDVSEPPTLPDFARAFAEPSGAMGYLRSTVQQFRTNLSAWLAHR